MIRRGLAVVLLALLVSSAQAGRQLLGDAPSALTVANCQCGTKFVDLLIKHGFGEALNEAFRGTLFVPCDKAVAALPKMTEDKLKATLAYHIVVAESGPVTYLKQESPLQTFWKSGKVSVQCEPNKVVGAKNSALIIRGPEEVCEGATVVCIDTVLIPPPPPSKEEEKCYVEVPVPCSPVNVPKPSPCVEVEQPKVIKWVPKPCPSPVVETCPPSPKPSPCNVPHKGEACVSIWNIINNDPRLRLLAKLLEIAGVKTYLKTMEKATFFAPTDEAIVKTLLWLNVTQEDLFANKAALRAILQYHIIPGIMLWHDEIACGTPHYKTMLRNSELTMHAGKDCVGTHSDDDGEWWVIEGDVSVANVVEYDLHGCRILVHVIDFMLLPDECDIDGLFSGSKPATTPCPTGTCATSTCPPAYASCDSLPPFFSVDVALNTVPCLSTTRDLFKCNPKLYNLTLQTCTESHTFFLPTNDAWDRLKRVNHDFNLEQLLQCNNYDQCGQADGSNVALLREKILRLHILYQQYQAIDASLPKDTSLVSMLYQRLHLTHTAGQDFYVAAEGSTAAAKVINPNNAGGKSLFHIVDNVLITDFCTYYGAPAQAPLVV